MKTIKKENKPPPTEKWDSSHLDVFLTNYDVIRVERRTAEFIVINSTVQKRAQNRKKSVVETTRGVRVGPLQRLHISVVRR